MENFSTLTLSLSVHMQGVMVFLDYSIAKFFPVIERRVYWERTAHHDFSEDTFEGEPIDNYQVVREYVKDEVIDKSN
jgi:hypothetical protein